MKVFDLLVGKLQEPSTWRGIVGILTAVGVYLSPEQIEAVVAGGLAVMGLINVFRKERPAVPAAMPPDNQAGYARLRGLVLVAALSVLTLCCFHMGGCATTGATQQRVESTTIKTLGALSIAIKESKGVVDVLYASGKISKSEYNSFAVIRKQAWLAFLTADDAAQAAITVGVDPTDYPESIKAMAGLLRSKGSLDNMLVEFGVLPAPAAGVK